MSNMLRKYIALFLIVISCFSIITPMTISPANASGETFIIDPGHGGTDPGAILGSRYESNDVLRLSLRVGEIIKANGQTVAFTRTTDTYLSLSDRSSIANAGKHKFLISVHRNSSIDTSANGLETYYYSGLSDTSTAAKFASAIQNNVIAVAPFKNRGVKTKNLHMVREPNMPSCLIETGFIKNTTDNNIYDNYFEQIAQAIAKGMLSMVGSGGDIVIPEPATNKLNGNSHVNMGSDFYARIKHPGSGKYVVDYDGNVQVADFTGGDEEIWHFMRQANGAYLIGCIKSHMFWDVENSKYEDGTNIKSNLTVNYGNNQKFFIYYINKNFYFMPAGGDKTVDVSASSGNVQLYGSDIGTAGTAAEIARAFELEILSIYDGTKAFDTLGESFTATIKNINSNKFITANGSVVMGEDENGSDNQKWIFTRMTNGTYVIESVTEGTVFSVAGAPLDCTNVRVTLAPLTGGKYQTFFVIQKDDAYYIKMSYSYNAVDMAAITHNINLHNTGSAPEQFAAQKFEITILDDNTEKELVLKPESSFVKNESELNKVKAPQTASDILANFENQFAVIKDAEGNIVEADAKVGTGYVIALVIDGETIESLSIIIKGDVDGNGLVNATDYLKIKSKFLESTTFEGVYFKSADIDENGKINSTDYLRLKQYFLGSFDIF